MPDIRKALNEATNSAGGFLVPEEWSAQLLALVQQKAITMQDLDQRQMATDIQYIPKVTAGSTAYWPTETGAITASNPQYGQITLTAKKIAALTDVSSEILEDNNVDLANHLIKQMMNDLSIELDKQILTGSGTPWYGLNNTASYTNAVDGYGNINATGAVGTGSSITGGTIKLAVISKAVTEILKDNHEQPDVSYWNPKTIGQIGLLTDSTSRPILDMNSWANPLVRDGQIPILYGTRLRSTTSLPTNLSYGTTAALSAACADALVGRSGEFGILGNRRGFVWKTDYGITSDVYVYQTTARFAFSVKYPNAYCMIRAISDS